MTLLEMQQYRKYDVMSRHVGLTFSGYRVKCPLPLSGISPTLTQTAKRTIFASLLCVMCFIIFEYSIKFVLSIRHNCW